MKTTIIIPSTEVKKIVAEHFGISVTDVVVFKIDEGGIMFNSDDNQEAAKGATRFSTLTNRDSANICKAPRKSLKPKAWAAICRRKE